MAKIKGMDKAQKRLRDMAKKQKKIEKEAMREAVISIWQKAITHTTRGAPRYLNRKSGTLAGAIDGVVTQHGKATIGTVGIPPHVWYGKAWELGFKRRVGKGRTRVKFFKPRPWLSDAYRLRKRAIRKRFAMITKDLLKVTMR